MTLQELIAQYGIPIAIAVYTLVELLKVAIRWSNAQVQKTEKETAAETKREDAVTDLALSNHAERRERQDVIDKLQTSINHLTAENLEIKLKQAEVTGDYAGRLSEVKEAMQRERDEWKTERLANDEKFRLMALDISELKKHREQSTLRIQELESQIAVLEKQLAAANVDNDILQAQKRELESLLQKETNRANTLSALVDKIRAIDSVPPVTATPLSDATQSIPEVWDEDKEQTLIIPPKKLADEDGNPKPLPHAVDPKPDNEDTLKSA